ncbi:MAG: hypothetical protein K0S65_669, partial [Labilithrix sp.]|nr:hypothetical protein [Labilithrix sp.]
LEVTKPDDGVAASDGNQNEEAEAPERAHQG